MDGRKKNTADAASTSNRRHGNMVREKLMDYLAEYFARYDYAPSMEEMTTVLCYSEETLRHHFRKLRQQGRVTYLHGSMARTLRLTAKGKPTQQPFSEAVRAYGGEFLIAPQKGGRKWWAAILMNHHMVWDVLDADSYDDALSAARAWWQDETETKGDEADDNE
jgi:AraC-like DNA-binding protein